MPRAPLVALLALLALSACGEERTRAPDLGTPLTPQGVRTVKLPAAGVAFTAPANWSDSDAREPRVGGIQSGRATLAVWRYVRSEPLPEGAAELRRVRGLLVDRVEERDPTFRLASSRVTRRADAPAVELTGAQTIAGRPVRVRSAHVYTGGAELVVDAYAAPQDFDRVDATVFEPALRSLRVAMPR